jgi:hypothetical protein
VTYMMTGVDVVTCSVGRLEKAKSCGNRTPFNWTTQSTRGQQKQSKNARNGKHGGKRWFAVHDDVTHCEHGTEHGRVVRHGRPRAPSTVVQQHHPGDDPVPSNGHGSVILE